MYRLKLYQLSNIVHGHRKGKIFLTVYYKIITKAKKTCVFGIEIIK